MRIHRFSVWYFFSLLFGNMLLNGETYGQSDTLTLNTVKIEESYAPLPKNVTSFTFDSAQYASFFGLDGGEFIKQNTGIYVKDYGPGTTTTLSYRGGTANHTKVYWEGISVDNAMLGQSDLSLFTFNQGLQTEFLKGGNSLSLGSGGFGGILNVHSGEDKWQGLSVDAGVSYGSFNTQQLPLDLFIGNGKWKFELTSNYISSDNDFEFINYLDENKVEKRENAAFERFQILPKLSFKANKYHDFSVAAWVMHSDREVPAPIEIKHGNAIQEDVWNRFMFEWNYNKSKWRISAKSSYIQDEMYYENQSINVSSSNSVNSFKNLFTATRILGGYKTLETQVKADYTAVYSNNYIGPKSQRLLGIYESFKYQRSDRFLRANLRVEMPSSERIYALPSVNVGFMPFKHKLNMWLFSNLSYNARYPTFNEMYWQNSGNPQLKEETSLSAELGVNQAFIKGNKGSIDIVGTLFYSIVENMIVWAPINSIWTPQNIKSANNKGFELEAKTSVRHRNWSAFLNLGYTYTASLTIENEQNPEYNGFQQIYVPVHKGQLSATLRWKSYFVTYRQVLSGEVFVSSDNKQEIPANYPAGVEIGKQLKIKEARMLLKLSANNLFNENYQYVRHMPMPMRHYTASIAYNFNH